MGSSVLGVPYGAGYMWGVVVRGTLWSRVHVGSSVLCTLWSRVHVESSVLGVPYGAGYMWRVMC